jgi:ribonuclease-3
VGILGRRTTALEKALGYTFRNLRLLDTALVHPSYRCENAEVGEDNQRMEFLGDAVLGMLAADYVYRKHRHGEEGLLTTLRSRITSGKALAEMSHSLGLGEKLKLGKGEEKSGGRRRPSNLADVLEAVLGAAYLDGGCKAVEKIFARLFVPILECCGDDVWSDNPKGCLQDLAQRVLRKSPSYRIAREEGPSHRKTFTVQVTIGGTVWGHGSGPSKRAAEADAASDALLALKKAGLIGR